MENQKKEKEKKEMAKNWTLSEAVVVINEGTNVEAVQEITKRFPLASVAIAKMGMNEGIKTLFGAMPEHMTMLKMERALKDGVEESEEDVDDAEDTEEAGDADLSAMSTKELMKLCDKRGIKVPHYGKNKQFYLDALAGGASADTEDEDEVDEDETDAPDYEEMSAPELYKLCKERGIKVEPKKKASYYVAALKKADEAEAQDDEEESWDDEEEAKPAKKEKASDAKPAKGGKPAKGAGKKAAKVEDDEEDWDI